MLGINGQNVVLTAGMTVSDKIKKWITKARWTLVFSNNRSGQSGNGAKMKTMHGLTTAQKPYRHLFIWLLMATVQINGFATSSWADSLQNSFIDFNKAPELTLLKKISASRYFVTFINRESGVAGITWSLNGKLLAAYTKYHQVLNIWTSSGLPVQEIQIYGPSYLPPPVLAFIGGSQKLALTPSSLRQSDTADLNKTMITILNLSNPLFLQNIDGNKPLGSFLDNQAVTLRISPDQTMAAILAGRSDDRRQVSVYSTLGWHRVAIFRDTVTRLPDFVSSIAFSPDNRILAVGRHYGRIQLYSLTNRTLTRTIDAFSDVPAPDRPTAAAISFSPDSSLIAVGAGRGGGTVIVDGVRRPAAPSDPVRIFSTENGKQTASTSGFTAGIWTEETNSFAWTSRGDFLAFVSGEGDLHIWDPYHPNRPHGIVSVGLNTLSLSVSPDGSTIAVGVVPSGILLFNVGK